MRLTLDTNILVSAFVAKQGHSATILELALTLVDIELILSDPILDEFQDVLGRDEVRSRFAYTEQQVRQAVEGLRASAKLVSPSAKVSVVKEDPKDNVILSTALSGKADYIVSGDKHLLDLGKYRGIRIVNPRGFVQVLSKKFPEFIFFL